MAKEFPMDIPNKELKGKKSQPLDTMDHELIQSQQALLQKIHFAIDEERKQRKSNQEDLKKRFLELREETIGIRSQQGAEDTDLPMLHEQMHYQLSLAARKTSPLPSKEAPYFAHLLVEEQQRIKQYLLGYYSFISSHTDVSIVDWRNAPIAKIFFEYRQGEDYEVELPGRTAQGVILQRNILTIQEGKLVCIQNDLHKFTLDKQGVWRKQDPRDFLQLSGGQGTTVQQDTFGVGRDKRFLIETTALLDPDQYALLSEDPFRPLLILGGAGSGKTTVALHRIAHLCYMDPKQFREETIQIIVPEPGLVTLCQNLLKNLRFKGVMVDTFDHWIDKQRKRRLKGLPKKLCEDTPASIVRLKRHHRIMSCIDFFVQKKFDRDPKWLEKCPAQMLRLDFFTDKESLMHLVDHVSVKETHIDQLIRHTKEQFFSTAAETYKGFDPERIETLDGQAIDWMTPDEKRGSIDIEDFPILFELLERQRKFIGKSKIKLNQYSHLVIDEAQEFAPIEMRSLGKTLPSRASLSIAGDAAQSTDQTSSFQGWETSLKSLNLKSKIVKTELKTNYRSPKPIAALAQYILNPLNIHLPEAQRGGAPIKYDRFQEQGLANIQMIETLSDLMTREGRSSIAVICRSEEYATVMHQILCEHLRTRLVLDGDFTFKPGIDVTSVTSVKGLEFDYVVLPDGNNATYSGDPHTRRLFYVAISRAMHQLWVINSGSEPFRLIEDFLEQNISLK